MLAAIYGYHTGTQGWCDTAYNFIIDRFGRIWEGRSGGIAKAIVGELKDLGMAHTEVRVDSPRSNPNDPRQRSVPNCGPLGRPMRSRPS